MDFTQLLMIGMLVEAVTDAVKRAVPSKEQAFSWPYVLAMAVGILLSFVFGVNIVDLIGIQPVVAEPVGTIVGSVLTGVLFGRPSNYINDLWGVLNEMVPKK